ncbi:hypothetical protein ACET3Z_012845 [Daucus carota]
MYGNHFEGPLPLALANCKWLKVLDIGHNTISGAFPLWLVTLGELEVLVLRSNRLNGTLSLRNIAHPFPKIRVLDLSHNELTGNLPIHYFDNMKAGKEYEVGSLLHIYTVIDLSCNRFQGKVPKVTGELRWLALLNLSYNSLTGLIPSVLGNMEALQSLDLSSNQLTGRIPHQLTSLTFLSTLNLSENHLTGEIPRKGQFSTFTNSSYLGNSALCGSPLTKKCMHTSPLPQGIQNDDEDENYYRFFWEVIVMGYSCGLICGFSTGYIIFTIGSLDAWFVRYINKALELSLWRRFMKPINFKKMLL